MFKVQYVLRSQYDIEMLFALVARCERNLPVISGSRHKGPVMWGIDVLFVVSPSKILKNTIELPAIKHAMSHKWCYNDAKYSANAV